MSSLTLYRLSGISLLIGCVGVVLGIVPLPLIGDSPSSLEITAALVGFLGCIFIIIGLPGLYSRLAPKIGALGLVGFLLLLFFFLTQGVIGETLTAFIEPFLAATAPAVLKRGLPPSLEILFLLGGVAGLVGGILFSIAIMRVAVVSRWAGILFLVGAVVTPTGSFLLPAINAVGTLLFMIGLVWFSSVLWSSQPPVSQPEPSPSAVQA